MSEQNASAGPADPPGGAPTPPGTDEVALAVHQDAPDTGAAVPPGAAAGRAPATAPVRARVRARTGRAAAPVPNRTVDLLATLVRVELPVVAAVLLLVSALPLLGRFDWRADLFSHFALHTATAALVVTMLCRSFGQRVGVGLALVALALNLITVAAGLAPAFVWERPATSGASVRVAALNVLASNTDHARVAAWLESSGADLVVLSEVTPQWRDLLSRLERSYPHRALSFGRGRGDVAVLSRLPIAASAVETVADQPLVSARVTKDGRALTVLAAHPDSPMTAGRWTARDRMLKRLADRAAAAAGPVLVVGDLNTTPWSGAFAALLEEGRLSGPLLRAGTYPSWLDAFGLPIDHMLAGNGAWVDGLAAAAAVGSDHRPIAATVRF